MNREDLRHSLVSKVKELAHDLGETPNRSQFLESGASDYSIRALGGYEEILKLAGLEPKKHSKKKSPSEAPNPKILVFDIETSPMELYGFGLFDQNFSLDQIKTDWYVLSWAAKWFGSPENEVMYNDCRETAPDDYGIISQIWQLLDEADCVLTQNGTRFDVKKLNARFLHHGFPEPSSYLHIDTLKIARKKFALTSNKLEYMTDKFCVKYKKLSHGKFAGFKLWRACLEGNLEAWEEMKKYNMYDVLSLEELYMVLRRWDKSVNFNAFSENEIYFCSCGSSDFKWVGYAYGKRSRKDKYICTVCSQEHISKENLLTKAKKNSLMS